MHDMAVFWLRVATALYGVGLLHVMAVLLRRKSGFLKPALFAFLVAAVLHFVAIVEMANAVGHLPVDNFFESATVCGFLIAVLFLFVYWRYDAASLSVCIFPLVFMTCNSSKARWRPPFPRCPPPTCAPCCYCTS